jgi:ABC-type multidrug transport system fused ATPase/permease subunit
MRAAMNAYAVSLPALASVLAFVTYSLTGHSLSAANIFTSLTLFQLLRMPLMFLRASFITPLLAITRDLTYLTALSLSTIADAATACGRLYNVFEAETLDETLVINDKMDVAVKAEGVSFTWDSPPPKPSDPKKKAKSGRMAMMKGKGRRAATPPTVPVDDANIFKVMDIDLEIPRGQLVAIVGAVGMGKTSLLQGLIGEMRRTSGRVEFGGSVGYCAQNAWIQVSSLVVAPCR